MNKQETIEVYAFAARGIAGAPMTAMGLHVTRDKSDVARPLATWADQTYWAVGTDASSDYPPVLMHIYYEGPLPPEASRNEINRAVTALTGQLLFGQDSGLTLTG